MNTIYTTTADYIAQEVAPALGKYADDYDMDAIAHDMLTWHEETHRLGATHANRSGFVVRDGVDFWDVAERHENN